MVIEGHKIGTVLLPVSRSFLRTMLEESNTKSALFHCNCEPGLPKANLLEANPLATPIPSNAWFLLYNKCFKGNLILQTDEIHTVYIPFVVLLTFPNGIPRSLQAFLPDLGCLPPDLFNMISCCCEQIQEIIFFHILCQTGLPIVY